MREEYDFTNAIKNPYTQNSKKVCVNIDLDIEIIDYFKDLSAKNNIPYQNLINSFLANSTKEMKEKNLLCH